MNKNNIDNVFQMVRFSEFDDLRKIVHESNVNHFVNEYGQNLLHEAIAQNCSEILNYLLYCNIDVNKVDRDGKTPLHYSTAYNNYAFTKLLLDSNGIEKGIKDRYGNNPMWVAVFNANDYYDVVKLLKQHGVDSQSKNNSNRSALDFARQIGDEELEQILIN
jgi:ankyrin repeat protein